MEGAVDHAADLLAGGALDRVHLEDAVEVQAIGNEDPLLSDLDIVGVQALK